MFLGLQYAGSLEMRFLIFDVVIITILAAFFAIGELFGTKEKRGRARLLRLSLPIFASVILFGTSMQYALYRPSSPISILVMTAADFLLILGFMGVFILLPFKKWEVFGKFTNRERFVRFVFVLFDYIVLFAIVSLAIGYAVLALIQPSTAQMNPEVRQYIIPTITALVLIYYRLQSQFHFVSLEIPSRITEDAIVASFAVFAYGGALSSAQVTFTTPLGNLASTFPIGIAVGLFGLFLERYLLAIQRAFPHSFFSQLKSFPDAFLEMFRSSHQSTLSDFSESEQVTSNPRVTLPHRLKFLETKAARRILLGVIMVILIIGALSVYYSPQKETTLILPAWVVQVDLVKVPNSPVVLSDQVDLGSPRNYSVRIVRVTVGNSTYLAPLNSRYLRLNSSEFAVISTEYFLAVQLERRIIRISVMGEFYTPNVSDQTQNPDFAYYPVFRDAEIYYALYSLGYMRTVAFCQQISYGTSTKNTKQILATSSSGDRVLVTIAIDEDMFPPDSTLLQSLDSKAIEEIQNLLTQAKVATSMNSVVSQPSIPSWATNITQTGSG